MFKCSLVCNLLFKPFVIDDPRGHVTRATAIGTKLVLGICDQGKV